MNLKSAKYVLSRMGLLHLADSIRFRLHRLKTATLRRKFRRDNPGVELPPDYLIYESFKLDYWKYYFGGKETARWVISILEKYIPLDQARILDWGCGPARVARHLPDLLKQGCQVFGTDYNPASIQWDRDHVHGVGFSVNMIEPPLPFADQFFDAVYGISIFTHLSEKLHHDWFSELTRITRPGGIILLTLQGRAFTGKLTLAEQQSFEQGNLVVRGHTKIGHRTFSAFHPEKFVRELAGDHTVAGFEPGGVINGLPVQDVWTIRVQHGMLLAR